jgi:hypothetical protein
MVRFSPSMAAKRTDRRLAWNEFKPLTGANQVVAFNNLEICGAGQLNSKKMAYFAMHICPREVRSMTQSGARPEKRRGPERPTLADKKSAPRLCQ